MDGRLQAKQHEFDSAVLKGNVAKPSSQQYFIGFPETCTRQDHTIPRSSITYSLHCSSFFGLTHFRLRILKGNPKKGLQWRL